MQGNHVGLEGILRRYSDYSASVKQAELARIAGAVFELGTDLIDAPYSAAELPCQIIGGLFRIGQDHLFAPFGLWIAPQIGDAQILTGEIGT